MTEINPIILRCEYLRSLLPQQLPFLFFLHIPKTAGTQLARTLQESKRFNVFSLDASEETFSIQRTWFSSDRPTIVRAHLFWRHAWGNLLQYFPNAKPFSVIRSPYAVHFSMASMVRDRALVDQHPQVDYYRSLIQPEPDGYLEMAPIRQISHIICNAQYQAEYGELFSKYLSFAEAIHPDPFERCRFVPISMVDRILEIGCDYTKERGNYNQTAIAKSLSASDLLNSGVLEEMQGVISPSELALWRRADVLAREGDCSQLLQFSFA
jgi:hypothetical protein